jgi:hypothetical protein
MRRIVSLLITLVSVSLAVVGGIVASPAIAHASTCQRCDVGFISVNSTGNIFLGNNDGDAVVYPADGNATQQWDVYPITGTSYYAIYNYNTNNLLTRSAGCVTNDQNLMYCAAVQAEGSSILESQEWIEVRTDPMVFESVGSGGRCLYNPGYNISGLRVGLYPCNDESTAQQWLG